MAAFDRFNATRESRAKSGEVSKAGDPIEQPAHTILDMGTSGSKPDERVHVQVDLSYDA